MADHDRQGPKPTLKILTTVPSGAEAVMVIGDLEAAGIPATQQPGAQPGGLWGTPTVREIYVEEKDLERAREVLDTETISEEELVEAEEEAGRRAD